MIFSTSDSRDTETCTPEGERESPRRPCHSAEDAVVKWALEHLGPRHDLPKRSDEG